MEQLRAREEDEKLVKKRCVEDEMNRLPMECERKQEMVIQVRDYMKNDFMKDG